MGAQKIGRNDLCPCGNGKKYKKCHGASPTSQTRSQPVPRFPVRLHPTNTVPPEVLAKGMSIIREQQRQEQERQRRYGLVRPEIAGDFKGYKFVAIGSTLLYLPSDSGRFFTDVLLAYVPQLFGRKWCKGRI